jgi:tRNA-specific 2-thiouridylase
MKKKKAIALISGGLDSMLAVKIISDQNVGVIGFHFLNYFNASDSERIKALGKTLGIEIRKADIGQEFLKILMMPKHGYGKNLNPCIDCRILGIRKAYQLMKELGASFIVTGEVLGQRPMSQNKRAMELIEKESGASGFLVRPLSAKLLTPTIPEEKGWINREKLLDIEGRSRKRQLELAKKYKISGYSSPAGGCLLTDPGFSLKVKDLMDAKMLNVHSIDLIKNGRYFRINDSFKLVVGRNHEENMKLVQMAEKGDIIIEPKSKGPLAIGLGKYNGEDIDTASRIVAYYCEGEEVAVDVKVSPGKIIKSFVSGGLDEKNLAAYRA